VLVHRAWLPASFSLGWRGGDFGSKPYWVASHRQPFGGDFGGKPPAILIVFIIVGRQIMAIANYEKGSPKLRLIFSSNAGTQ
jgi:hypothetical protein